MEFPTLYKEYGRALDVVHEHSGQVRTYRPLSQVGIRRGTKAEMGDARAMYDPINDVITLGRTGNPREMLSSVLHEVQHAVQQREGFYGGVQGQRILNETRVLGILKGEQKANLEEAVRPLRGRLEAQGVKTIEQESRVLDGLILGGERGEVLIDSMLGDGAYARIRPTVLKRDIEQMAEIRRKIKELAQREQEYLKTYWNAPGEVEGRNVQARFSGSDITRPSGRGMDADIWYEADELRATHPELTAEVFPEQMVYPIGQGGKGTGALDPANIPEETYNWFGEP
jgi:hypothetical protein